MPVEFNCNQCQRRLRVPDGSEGRQTKCPGCGSILTIPATGTSVRSDAAQSPAPTSAPAPEGLRFSTPVPLSGASSAPNPAPLSFTTPDMATPGQAPSIGQPPGSSPFGEQGATVQTPLDSSNPFQSPAAYEYTQTQFTRPRRGPIQPTRVSFSQFLSESLSLLARRYGAILGAMIVGLLACVATMIGVSIVVGILLVPVGLMGGPLGLGGPFGFGMILTAFLLYGAWFVCGVFYSLGMARCILNVASGNPLDLGDIFRAGPQFLRGLGLMFLLGLATFGLYMLFIGVPTFLVLPLGPSAIPIAIGGMIVYFVSAAAFWLTFGFSVIALVDQDTNVSESLDLSRRVTRGNRWALFFVWVIAGLSALAAEMIVFVPARNGDPQLVVMIGSLVFCFFLFLLWPWSMAFFSSAYLLMTGRAVSPSPGMTGSPFASEPAPGPTFGGLPTGDQPFSPNDLPGDGPSPSEKQTTDFTNPFGA